MTAHVVKSRKKLQRLLIRNRVLRQVREARGIYKETVRLSEQGQYVCIEPAPLDIDKVLQNTRDAVLGGPDAPQPARMKQTLTQQLESNTRCSE